MCWWQADVTMYLPITTLFCNDTKPQRSCITNSAKGSSYAEITEITSNAEEAVEHDFPDRSRITKAICLHQFGQRCHSPVVFCSRDKTTNMSLLHMLLYVQSWSFGMAMYYGVEEVMSTCHLRLASFGWFATGRKFRFGENSLVQLQIRRIFLLSLLCLRTLRRSPGVVFQESGRC